jgi:hypothetical protein
MFAKQLASLESSIKSDSESMLSHISVLKTLTNVAPTSESANFAQGMAHDDMMTKLKAGLDKIVEDNPCPSLISEKVRAQPFNLIC